MARTINYGVAIAEEVLGEGASVPLQGGTEAGMEKAAALGFDCVEIHLRDAARIDPEDWKRLAARYGLRIAAIGTGLEYGMNGLSLTSDDPAIRAKAAAKMRDFIDLAAPFGAVVFLGLIRGKCGKKALLPAYLDRLAQELAPLAAYAEERSVPTGFEPVAYYFSDLLNTTQETLDFLSRPGLESIGLLLDTHHMFIEDKDIGASFRSCAGRITHVHISDSNRRYPGAGNVDYGFIARTLDAIGYAGAVSLEILPDPSGEEAARRGLAWMRSTWGM